MTDDQQSNGKLHIVIGDRLPIVLVCLALGLAFAGFEAYCGDTKVATITLALLAAILAWLFLTKRLRIVLGARPRLILVCLVLGLAIAASQAMGGNTKGAIANLAVYAAIIAWVALGKSEFLETMLQVDERQKHIMDKARQTTGVTMAYLLVGWSIYNFMHGNFSGPIVILCVATGAVFLASAVFYHYQS